MIQNLAIASDHAGYNLKTFLVNQLDSDINIKDFGTDNENSCDFPDFAQELCNFINESISSRGLFLKLILFLVGNPIIEYFAHFSPPSTLSKK